MEGGSQGEPSVRGRYERRLHSTFRTQASGGVPEELEGRLQQSRGVCRAASGRHITAWPLQMIYTTVAVPHWEKA